MTGERPPRTEVSRLEGFSDAVFGFALTLLVVAVEVPRTFDGLFAMLNGFVPFAASFAILYWIWFEHRRFFRSFGLEDGPILILNGLLLFVVLFYVYPLKFMFTFLAGMFFGVGAGRSAVGLESVDQSRTLLLVYGAGFVAVFGLLASMYGHARRRSDVLALSALERRYAGVTARAHLLSAFVGVVSMALTWLLPPRWLGFAGLVYALLGPLHAAHGYWSGRPAPQPAE
jgi:uncharacterized membrane protein